MLQKKDANVRTQCLTNQLVDILFLENEFAKSIDLVTDNL